MTLKFIIFLLIIPALVQQVSAQPGLTITTERKGRGDILYASNSNYCPVSMALDLNMENATFTNTKDSFFVIPARTERMLLGTVKIYDRRQKWSYTSKVHSCFGDLSLRSYDSLYEYELPYPRDSAFAIIQGYGGAFSHQQVHALDFNMSEGTPILAARGGVVFQACQEYDGACLEDSCKTRGNWLMIYHTDGSMAGYGHIRQNGLMVKVGDTVTTGQLLAYSGNTGYSAGPHLHFDCFLPNPGPKRTFPTKFITEKGKAADYLDNGIFYRKAY